MEGESDPRHTGEFIRRLHVNGSDLVLVGVVHDHPASKYRVKTVVEAVDPEILALELPPIAVSLYEQYASDERTPPAFGGEMSTAIKAASADQIVGIDGPSPAFIHSLLRNTARETDPRETVPTVLKSLLSVSKQAAICRLAAVIAARTGIRLEIDPPATHESVWADDPATQARDEQRRVRRAETITAMFEQPDTACVRKETRDTHMASRLDSLRPPGDIVAIVGIAHLDPIVDTLRQSQ